MQLLDRTYVAQALVPAVSRLFSTLFTVFLFASAARSAGLPYFSVLSDDAGAWPQILASIGLQRQPAGVSRIFVARTGAAASVEWFTRVDRGSILILEGESSLADLFGFRRSRKDPVRVQSLTDVHSPALSVVWEKGLELPVFEMPEGAQVFARERWTGAPMTAGMKRGTGAVLWVAAPPGERGSERFPYLLNALSDLGLEQPFRSNRLWAFFDSAYRTRVDVDYFAARWRRAGIAALHVAAWHNFEPDAEADAWLDRLIAACHREGILVYAWFELPHVSEKFWADHPAWREQTAMRQDAQLDWRKLMNLTNRECYRAVASGVRAEIARFDWDGVNLAELYFESLEGIANPSRFTPMNADVRALFQQKAGFDPLELFATRADNASRRAFLDFRAALARNMQEEWLAEIDQSRCAKPDLDLVLTHVDDRLDTAMRDSIGADAARVLPLLDTRSFTFLVEDPATLWNLGPERYPAIADRYRPLTTHPDKLAIDVNIVERYQNVYPTKQQTGTELFQLVHRAAASFPRVALYFEYSLLPADLKLLPAAASAVSRFEHMGPKTVVDSPGGAGIPWKGGARVDGELWPAQDDDTLWLPAGPHAVEPAPPPAGPRLVHLNGDLKAARAVDAHTLEFTYRSSSRAIAVFSRPPRKLQIDGADHPPTLAGPATLLLPRGQHVVTLSTD
jgi:hypothetical protein